MLTHRRLFEVSGAVSRGSWPAKLRACQLRIQVSERAVSILTVQSRISLASKFGLSCGWNATLLFYAQAMCYALTGC